MEGKCHSLSRNLEGNEGLGLEDKDREKIRKASVLGVHPHTGFLDGGA